MSFATKICASACNIGLRSLAFATRNFTMMARPTAAATPATSIQTTTPTITKLLQPFNSIITQVAGFKVKNRLRKRCKDCYYVIRHQRHYIICPTHPRHKQMSMKKRDYNSWILTHATQSKVRPY